MKISKQVTAWGDFFGTSSTLCVGLASILTHLLLVGLVELHHTTASEVQSITGGQQSQKSNLDSGVVENLVLVRLWILSITILELTANSSVAGSDGHTTSQNTARLQYDSATDPSEGSVDERRGGRTQVLASAWVDTRETSKHADMRDFDLVEQQETVIHGVVTKLGTNVTDVDVLERLVCLEITDLNDEGVGAVGLVVDIQLSHDDSVIGSAAEGADPPLAGSQGGRVDDEGLVFGAPCCCRLETSYVGTMAKLSLSVTTNVLVVSCRLQELLVLLGRALIT